MNNSHEIEHALLTHLLSRVALEEEIQRNTTDPFPKENELEKFSRADSSIEAIVNYLFTRRQNMFINVFYRYMESGNLKNPLVIRPWLFPEEMLYDALSSEAGTHTVFIVGAHHGSEVARFSDLASVQECVLFEPVPDNFKVLCDKVRHLGKYVHAIEAAISDTIGSLNFYDSTNQGNGSLLAPTNFEKEQFGTEIKEIISVDSITLDFYCSISQIFPTVLWIDVQGAEMHVIRGSGLALRDCIYIYIEVSVWRGLYSGGSCLLDIDKFLNSLGYLCIQLGTDLGNGTGNALYKRKS